MQPFPRRPEHSGRSRLGCAGRNGDEKVLNLPTANGFEVFADCFEVPAPAEFPARFDDGPGRFHEDGETIATLFSQAMRFPPGLLCLDRRQLQVRRCLLRSLTTHPLDFELPPIVVRVHRL